MFAAYAAVIQTPRKYITVVVTETICVPNTKTNGDVLGLSMTPNPSAHAMCVACPRAQE